MVEGQIFGVLIMLVAFYVLPAIFVAQYAQRKGRSFPLFLAIGLVLGWLVSLILAILVKDKEPPPETATTPAPIKDFGFGPRLGPADDYQMKQAIELRDGGALTPEQFEAEKARILRERATYGTR